MNSCSRVAARYGLFKTTFNSAIGVAASVLRILLPTDQHGYEIVPAMQQNHQQMPEDKRQHGPHDHEMPESRQVKSAHQPGKPRELHRLPAGKSGQYRKHPKDDRRRVRMLLQRIVGLVLPGLWTEEKVLAHHGPHARY